MKYHIEWAENKSADWKVVTAREMVEGGRTYEDCSINKVNKTGQEFPGFDGIMAGSEIEADFWMNQANNRKYLFAPRPKPAPGAMTRGTGAAGVKAAQERKAADIATAQDRKEDGIKVSATMRDSTLLAIASLEGSHFETVEEREEALVAAHAAWRIKYLAAWKAIEDAVDQAF